MTGRRGEYPGAKRLTLIDVIHFELSWTEAAGAAASVGVVAVALRLARRPRLAAVGVFAQETALVLGLFALWQYAGSFAVLGPGGALGRAHWIWNFERAIHLPSEAALQRVFLPHPLIIEFMNLYYAGLHFTVLIACMIWLFVAHRERYRQLRTTLVAFTGACLLIQLIPVAPPRMLPGIGMVDTGVLYGQSVYQAHAGFDPDQLSAMPSVHVGWAILVAIAVIGTARTRWRWLALLYPAMTSLAVVVTANHFWLDGIVAAILLGAVLLVQTGVRRMRAATAAVAEPAPAGATESALAGVADPAPAGTAAAAVHTESNLEPGESVATSKSALYPRTRGWDHLGNSDPVSNGGGNGNGNPPEDIRGSAARRDWPA
jgi:PAP2 superfamily